jgi:predicted RNA binding protein YcfA (HicA-like mRNA interferase family)
MFPGRKPGAPWSGLGFVFKRQNGSHAVLRRGNRGCVVPMHREISRGTLKGVLEQAGVSVEEFMAAQ